MILLPPNRTRENFLQGFWRWVAILESGDGPAAVDALWWDGNRPDPEGLLRRYATFWGADRPWRVVIPNERLIGVINAGAQAEFEHFAEHVAHVGWGMAQVPVTPTPERAKDDDVELMGVATSFYLREHDGHLALQFEIIHL